MKKKYKLSEETKRRMSESKKGDKNPAKRLEVRKKIGETHKRLYAEGKHIHWAKGKHINHKGSFKKGYDKRRTGFQKGHKSFLTKESIRRSALSHTGEKSKLWKGENVSYYALHDWVERNYGKPKKCDFCGIESNKPRYFDWANTDHKYKRKLTDWIRLCKPCHRLYDSSLK